MSSVDESRSQLQTTRGPGATRHCVYGLCNSDSRYSHRDHMKDVFFIPFPKPKTNLEKCKRWIKACGRENFTCDRVSKWTYICSKHFVNGKGPTEEYPDPVPALWFVADQHYRRRSKKVAKASQCDEESLSQLATGSIHGKDPSRNSSELENFSGFEEGRRTCLKSTLTTLTQRLLTKNPQLLKKSAQQALNSSTGVSPLPVLEADSRISIQKDHAYERGGSTNMETKDYLHDCSTSQNADNNPEAASSAEVLLIEPFYAGSHKQLMDTLHMSIPGSQLVTMPGKKWPWKARTSALYLSQVIPRCSSYRTLFTSSVLNLAELVALRPDLQPLHKVVYFHENQLTYPVQQQQDRDFQFGYNQILSCLVADQVHFNSQYNMESFLTTIKSFLHKIPDHRPKGVEDMIRGKCGVLYFPIIFPNLSDVMDNQFMRTGDVDIPASQTSTTSTCDSLERTQTCTSSACDNVGGTQNSISSACGSVEGVNMITVKEEVMEDMEYGGNTADSESGPESVRSGQVSDLDLYKNPVSDNSSDLSGKGNVCFSDMDKDERFDPCSSESFKVKTEPHLEEDITDERSKYYLKDQDIKIEVNESYCTDTDQSVESMDHHSEGSVSVTGSDATISKTRMLNNNDCMGPTMDARLGAEKSIVNTDRRKRLKYSIDRFSARGPLHIVWPHRWEYDKGPEAFFKVMYQLQEAGCNFRLSVLGETFTEVPTIFDEARNHLQQKICNWGYIASKQKYYNILCTADCVVSTSLHEFFGVAMLEAVHCGCYPLCPAQLVYPEIYPKECLYNTLQQLFKRLRNWCRKPHLVRQKQLELDTERFSWESLKNDYMECLQVSQ